MKIKQNPVNNLTNYKSSSAYKNPAGGGGNSIDSSSSKSSGSPLYDKISNSLQNLLNSRNSSAPESKSDDQPWGRSNNGITPSLSNAGMLPMPKGKIQDPYTPILEHVDHEDPATTNEVNQGTSQAIQTYNKINSLDSSESHIRFRNSAFGYTKKELD